MTVAQKKKKHFKKILEYIQKIEKIEDENPKKVEQKLNRVFAQAVDNVSEKTNEMRKKLEPITVKMLQEYANKIDKNFSVLDLSVAKFVEWKDQGYEI